MTTDDLCTADWTAAPLPVSHPDSVTLIRRYYAELITRYHGRPADDAEVSEVITREPSDDLVPPTGIFVVARIGGAAVGCLGVRVLTADMAELTRMYVGPEARRRGVAGGLIAAAEGFARDTFGAERLRLDTRADLVEARALYARHGYREIERYNDSPYADHWFEKALA
ncbi:GNAT family N-acetyltransferase [Actinacidiphila paucisporea]|uniref:Acetyltransferase (GNAT) family protein n=1 Tax=Actinacidiphila paucisporea TaxID=310782 RepID=A0A1M7AU96_9ACTN|nr:GNAT family N-acetyltransferase [Actinacidiphila paucisporea]SHL46310.1 Acetyltransferase (GNAT) family protein [Actinacidiphila paucisporea]